MLADSLSESAKYRDRRRRREVRQWSQIDLLKRDKELYNPPHGEVQIVTVRPMRFLAIDGFGDPNTAPAYAEAVAALYAIAYGIKATRKKLGGLAEWKVGPLEGLWWMRDDAPYSPESRDAWAWTMQIRQPDDVTAAQFNEARAAARRKKKATLPGLDLLRLDDREEGRAAQTLHRGPYADEGPTIALLHEAIAARGHTMRGKTSRDLPGRCAPRRAGTVANNPAPADRLSVTRVPRLAHLGKEDRHTVQSPHR